jgi:UDP-N-acetylglucosamine transferase subunit ALG13
MSPIIHNGHSNDKCSLDVIYVDFEEKLTGLVSDYSIMNSSHLGYGLNFPLIDSGRNLPPML